MLDITSRNAEQYNPSLCEALAESLPNGKVVLMSPILYRNPRGFSYKKLISLIPKKWTNSEASWKRGVRALESMLNYLYLIIYISLTKPDVLHIQWLPYMEFVSFEGMVLKVIRLLNRKLKIVLTVHNIFPHNLTLKGKEKYSTRFKKVDKYIVGYIVHLNSSKKELSAEFNINENKIYVAYHGIYTPEGFQIGKEVGDRVYKRIILFGTQNRYKGADILMKALTLLPKEYLNRIRVKILGRTDTDLYEEYKDKAKEYNVEWINQFVPSSELYTAIGNSDLILLPYRKISQSGVLLLALSYRKPILTSDLPSFRETLEGYPNDYFFRSDSPESLSEMLIHFLDDKINEVMLYRIIEQLNNKYSWANSAQKTIEAYNSVISK